MQGKPVKDFSLPSTGGVTFRLAEARGTKLVLYSCLMHIPGRTAPHIEFPFERKRLYGKQVRDIERSSFLLVGRGFSRANGAGSRCRATSRRY